MERRHGHRVKRRIPCEFVYENHRYRGIVTDLSAGGVFLQTETALDPGSELELHLSAERFPEISLRARVARRRFTPAILATMIRRGVGLSVVEAPPEYYEALGEPVPEVAHSRPPRAEAEEVGIEIVVADDPPPEEEVPAGPDDLLDTEDGDEFEETFDAGGPWTSETAREVAPPPPRAPEEAPSPEPADGWISPAMPYPSEAIVVDDGELDEAHELLERLGANPVRHLGLDPARFRGWAEAPRIFLVAARSALRLRVPSEAEGVATIAVAEADSQTLCSMLRRQGFAYVVRRPVHPEALKLLFLRALYRDPERRAAMRLPFGYEVSLRSTLRRRPATLVEISAEGCRVYTGEGAEPGASLSLRIPREVADGRALTLRGRVVRCERRVGAPPDERVILAVRFSRLPRRNARRLAVLLSERSIGPATLPRRPSQIPAESPPKEESVGVPADATQPAPEAPAERRRHPRAALRHEVVTLEEGVERVRHVLFGYDLSMGGMRVEPHPELAVGDRVRLALYDAVCPESVVVEAEVVRDDGAGGLALCFPELPPGAAQDVRRIVENLPALEVRVGGGGRGTVLAEVLEDDA